VFNLTPLQVNKL